MGLIAGVTEDAQAVEVLVVEVLGEEVLAAEGLTVEAHVEDGVVVVVARGEASDEDIMVLVMR